MTNRRKQKLLDYYMENAECSGTRSIGDFLDVPNMGNDEMHIQVEAGDHAHLRSKGEGGSTNFELGNYDLDKIELSYRIRGVDVTLNETHTDEPMIDELLRAVENTGGVES